MNNSIFTKEINFMQNKSPEETKEHKQKLEKEIEKQFFSDPCRDKMIYIDIPDYPFKEYTYDMSLMGSFRINNIDKNESLLRQRLDYMINLFFNNIIYDEKRNDDDNYEDKYNYNSNAEYCENNRCVFIRNCELLNKYIQYITDEKHKIRQDCHFDISKTEQKILKYKEELEFYLKIIQQYFEIDFKLDSDFLKIFEFDKNKIFWGNPNNRNQYKHKYEFKKQISCEKKIILNF